MSEEATPRLDLRASDAERERASDILREQAALGRLDLDELAERLGSAFSARTRSELDGLLDDLPRPVPTPSRRDFDVHRIVYLSVCTGLVAIWALTGGGYFWPIWPVLGWGIGLLAHARGCGGSRQHGRHEDQGPSSLLDL